MGNTCIPCEDCIFRDGKYKKHKSRRRTYLGLSTSADRPGPNKLLRIGTSTDHQPWFKKNYGPNLTTVVAEAVKKEQRKLAGQGLSPKSADHLLSAVASEQRRLSCIAWSPEIADAAIRRVYRKSILQSSKLSTSLPGETKFRPSIQVLPPIQDSPIANTSDTTLSTDRRDSIESLDSLSTEASEPTHGVKLIPEDVDSDSDTSSSVQSHVPSDDDESSSRCRSVRLSVDSLPSEFSHDFSEQDCVRQPVVDSLPSELSDDFSDRDCPPVAELEAESYLGPSVSNDAPQVRDIQLQLELMKIQVMMIQLLAVIFIACCLFYTTCCAKGPSPVTLQSRGFTFTRCPTCTSHLECDCITRSILLLSYR